MTNTKTRSRRKFTAEFKAKVAMEALQERLTLSELSKKHEVHPNLITKWKNQLKEQSSSVFKERGEAAESDKDKLAEYSKILYAQARLINGLSLENPAEISDLVCNLMV